MTAKIHREPGPDCWCNGYPNATSYVKHVVAVSEQTGYEVMSSVFRCIRCGNRIAKPEKWRKAE